SRAQLPGGKAMPVRDLLLARAERFAPGTRLTTETSS
ncbi:MAG TPA: methionyl-tRNA formyltransferase, partial [Halomonas sp.]|nr:methionyl-tRNA formyltransferase [Halomonas sp.]